MVLEVVGPHVDQLAVSRARHAGEQRADRFLRFGPQVAGDIAVTKLEPRERIAPRRAARVIQRELAVPRGQNVVVRAHPRGARFGARPPICEQRIAEQELTLIVPQTRLCPYGGLPYAQVMSNVL